MFFFFFFNYCSIFMLLTGAKHSFNWGHSNPKQNKPFLLNFHLSLESPGRRKRKKKKPSHQSSLSVMALLSWLLMTLYTHVSSLSFDIYLSLLSFLALSIYPPLLPQAHIWLWGIDSDFIANGYGENAHHCLMVGQARLLFGRMYPSHTVEQTVRLNR